MRHKILPARRFNRFPPIFRCNVATCNVRLWDCWPLLATSICLAFHSPQAMFPRLFLTFIGLRSCSFVIVGCALELFGSPFIVPPPTWPKPIWASTRERVQVARPIAPGFFLGTRCTWPRYPATPRSPWPLPFCSRRQLQLLAISYAFPAHAEVYQF